MSPKLLNVLLASATFVLYYVVIGPLWTGAGSVWSPENSITSLRASAADYAATVEQANSLLAQAQELKSQYAKVDDEAKSKMEIMIPSSVDPVRLLSEITAIAARSGIALTGVSYAEAPSGDKLRGAYDIAFSVKTTYSKFKEFMSNYENSMRLFTLQSVAFSSPEAKDDPMTFQVRLRTYYLK